MTISKTDLIALGDPNTSLDGTVTFSTENSAVLKLVAVGAGAKSSTKPEQSPTVYVKDASGNTVKEFTLPGTGSWTDAACNITVELPSAGTYTISNANFQARINTIEVVETLPVVDTTIAARFAIAKTGTANPIFNTFEFAKDVTVADVIGKLASDTTVTVTNEAGETVATTDTVNPEVKYIISYEGKTEGGGDDPGNKPGSGDDPGAYVAPYKLVFDGVVATSIDKKGAVPEVKLYYSPDGIIDEDYRLVEGEDYTVKLKNNKAVYTGELPETFDKNSKAPLATIVGKNNFKFTKNVYFNIPEEATAPAGCELSAASIEIDMPEEVEFLKGGVTPKVRIYNESVLLRSGSDYTIKYSNNKTVGKAKVEIKGKGLYSGVVTKEFAIVKKDLSKVVIVAADKANKTSIAPATTIKVFDADGKALAAGKEYDKNIKYYYAVDTQVIDASGATITRGAGDRVKDKDKVVGASEITAIISSMFGSGYGGDASVTYAIAPKIFKGVKATFKTIEYAGDKTMVCEDDIVSMMLGKTSLVYGQDYIIDQNSYMANLKKGTATVNILGQNDYAGLTARVAFKIVEKSSLE